MDNIIENIITGVTSTIITGFIASAFTTFILTVLLQPCFIIENEGIKNGKFRVKLTSKQYFFSSINIRIEACLISEGDVTKHFDIDKEEHILLKRGKYRIFKATVPPEYEKKLKDNEGNIRIQVYMAHSFSGFGKAKEQYFKYNDSENKFLAI
jgi:hypothetical protein